MALKRDSYHCQALGPALHANIAQTKVLMVGAGGIGCELLKNLVMTGYKEIHIVDLDTIDLSNLNRQFLFGYEHIKKSKALVAKEVAQKFNPNIQIVAHHANIKDAEFNIEWFRGFTMVFNALDNLDARRHVNRMCLAADIPLIESGTTGFNGQVQVIKKGITACYDCTAKDAPKSFPVCTIRSTPSQPIHCIVWGKSYLLNEIFGTSEDQAVMDTTESADNAAEIAELKKESEALKKIRESVGTDEFPQMLFDKVFNADIARLRSMDDMWKSRAPPSPLQYQDILAKANALLNENSGDPAITKRNIVDNDQKVWSLEENLIVLNDSLERLSARLAEMKKAQGENSEAPTITFDKDDIDTLDFVAASANIRSHIFGIGKKARFDIKQMAGNIIPAIATTNAIVAGLCVLESFKVLKGEYDKAQEVFLTPFAPQRLLASDRPRPPNPECPVCSNFQMSIYVDFAKATLKDLVEDVVKAQLGFGEREFSVSSEAGLLFDPDETDNLEKTLSDLGLKPDSFVTIVDESDDDTFVNVVLDLQKPTEPLDKPIKGIVDQPPELPRKPKKEVPKDINGTDQVNGKHEVAEESSSGNLKRSRGDEADAPVAKKAKTSASSGDDDVVLVNDEASANGGAIVIDD